MRPPEQVVADTLRRLGRTPGFTALSEAIVADLIADGFTVSRPSIDGPGVPGSRATSREAAASVDRRSDRHFVLWVLGSRPCTADEITATLEDRWAPNQTAARLWELRRDEFIDFEVVDDRRVKRRTRTGAEAFVHRLTPSGEAMLEQLGDPRALFA